MSLHGKKLQLWVWMSPSKFLIYYVLIGIMQNRIIKYYTLTQDLIQTKKVHIDYCKCVQISNTEFV